MFTLGSVQHARPPEWDAQVIACDVLQLRRFGEIVAAKVVPRIAAPAWLVASGRADVRSRAHRDGWAFWEVSGAFVTWGDRTWSDVAPLASGALLASRYPRGIDRVTWPALEVQDSVELAIRQGGIEELVVAPSERYVIAYLNSGQGEAGYELVSCELRVIEGGPGFTLPCMPSPPQWSPDESRIVCVIGARTEGYNWKYNDRWWQSDAARAEDDETLGAEGGPMPYARILVHELATYTTVSHRVDVELPAGWVPDDPDAIHIPMLVSVGDDHVVITAPSGEPTRIAITDQSGRDGQTFRVR